MTSTSANDTEVEEVVKTKFPNSEIVQIQKINVGITRQTFGVTINNSGEIKKYIVQSYKNDSRNRKTFREFQNLTYLKQYLEEVSKEIYIIESSKNVLYLIKERLDGNILLAPQNIESYCQKLARITYKIHQIPLTTTLKNRLPTVQNKIKEFRDYLWKNIRLEQFDKMMQVLRSQDYTDKELVINHGDLWMGNFLWKDNEISGIIDWEDVRIGTRYYDLGIARFELFLAFGTVGLTSFTEEYNHLYGNMDRRILNRYDLAALFRVVGGISGWTNLWADFNRPDVNKELFYSRIDNFFNMVKDNFDRK